jgi:hypothetical protein
MAAPRFTNAQDLSDYLDIEDVTGKEALLQRYLVAAEVMCERYARRRFSPGINGYATPANGDDPEMVWTTTTQGRRRLRVPDLRAVTSVTHLGTTLLLGQDFDLGYASASYPSTHIDLAFSRGRSPATAFGRVSVIGGYEVNDLVIVGKFGFSPTPEDVKHAVYLSVAKQWKRRDAGFADIAFDEAYGQLRVAQGIPAEARQILASYRTAAVGVI